jgi:hypothetical protein
MNQWLGIIGLHLLPTFYDLYNIYNKQKTLKMLPYVPIQKPSPNKFQMYKVKEYK